MDDSSSSMAVLLRYPAAEKTTEPADPVRTVFLPGRHRAARNKLNVALVGAGNIARWAHLPVISKHPKAELRAVYSSSGVRGRSYGERFEAAYCTSDYQKILDDEDLDLFLITSRNREHAWQAADALRAGKNVFVEKPMALTIDECRELLHVQRESGMELAVGFNRRFAPSYRSVKSRLAQRNGPAMLNCRVSSPGISGDYWMASSEQGGAILGEACHFIDLFHWLLGAEYVGVSAYSLPNDQPGVQGSNNVVASFIFSDGSIGNLTYSTLDTGAAATERLEAFAPGLALSTEDFKVFSDESKRRSRSRSKLFPDKGYDAQLTAVIEAMRGGAAPPANVVDGARATLVCLAILDASRSGKQQSFDLEAFVSEVV